MTDLQASIRVRVVDEASAKTDAIAAATDRLQAAQVAAAQATRTIATEELAAAQAAVAEAAAKGQSATSSGELARAELRAANAAKKLAGAEIVVAREAARMAEEQRKAAAAANATAPAATAAAGGLFRVTDASRRAGYAMAGQFNAATEMIYNFSILSPATRQFGTSLVMAGGNAFAFAGMLGPIGVGIGALIGLVPAAISLFQNFGGAAEEAAEDTKTFTERIDELRAAQERMRRENAIRDGEGSLEDTEANLIRLRSERAQATAKRRAAQQELRGLTGDAQELTQAALSGQGPSDRASLQAEIERRLVARGQTQGNVALRAAGEVNKVLHAVEAFRSATQEEAVASAEVDRQERRRDELRAEVEQGQRTELVDERRETQAVARRRLEATVAEFGLPSADASALVSQGSTLGAEIDPRLLRKLAPEQREAFLGDSRLALRTAEAVDLAQRDADRARIEAVVGGGLEGEVRATGNELSAEPVIGTRRGGGAGAGRAELLLANTADPTASSSADIIEELRELNRSAQRQERLQAELARRRETDTGPANVGGLD